MGTARRDSPTNDTIIYHSYNNIIYFWGLALIIIGLSLLLTPLLKINTLIMSIHTHSGVIKESLQKIQNTQCTIKKLFDETSSFLEDVQLQNTFLETSSFVEDLQLQNIFLEKGSVLWSKDKKWKLIFQTDLNLVVYSIVDGNENGATWASNTGGSVQDRELKLKIRTYDDAETFIICLSNDEGKCIKELMLYSWQGKGENYAPNRLEIDKYGHLFLRLHNLTKYSVYNK